MNKKELKDKIDALIDEYEAEHEEEFEYGDYFDDDYYPSEAEENLDNIPLVFKPSEVELYCSPKLVQLIFNTGSNWKGSNWKDKFTDCSLRVYGYDDKCNDILIAYNDTADINKENKLNIETTGTAQVLEIISNTNQDLYFNGAMGIYHYYPIQIPTNSLYKESILVLQQFNITNE